MQIKEEYEGLELNGAHRLSASPDVKFMGENIDL
jgi:hypothetical protein